VRHKCDIQSLSYGPLVPSRGWDHQMGIGSIIAGAALPAAQAAAGVRAAPDQADAGCPAGSRQGFPEYLQWPDASSGRPQLAAIDVHYPIVMLGDIASRAGQGDWPEIRQSPCRDFAAVPPHEMRTTSWRGPRSR
jgi:hypothetical protein